MMYADVAKGKSTSPSAVELARLGTNKSVLKKPGTHVRQNDVPRLESSFKQKKQ